MTNHGETQPDTYRAQLVQLKNYDAAKLFQCARYFQNKTATISDDVIDSATSTIATQPVNKSDPSVTTLRVQCLLLF